MTIATIREYDDPEKRVKLFSDRAEETFKAMSGRNLTFTQLRRFYNQILSYREQIGADKPYEELLPYIAMVKAKAEYAYKRDKINDGFKRFIQSNIDQLCDSRKVDDFFIFCSLFEAVVAYSKGNLSN
ncbi:CRISPR-associated protein, Csm2 family [Desulfurispirillum indicum S5]|uniref:CRISPR system Cms protein Csm2 n=1 Tax=Desulfurispirillum indicum (strain ATCC BAA-1389 / DSM 22839 / S5) TaxID=653733 RepID=E6W3H5_DESIS|nr:type III-A CRISPR-associated protein Csm2 [Desulfurispirillum indicum]ADU65768.1 CRISPR-associated protein, Csm2 family [Desulfurispirillum indicum S5]